MSKTQTFQTTQERLVMELRHHFKGWARKVALDLSREAFNAELKNLKSDDVYTSFGFDCPEYALIRIMGRVSISIGRRLGEIYDKMPRYVTQARFGLVAEKVAPKIAGRLRLDVCIPYKELSEEDRTSAIAVVKRHVRPKEEGSAAAIEIRYNFNPNDSSRLRKDEEMASLLKKEGMTPIYLVFSTISPRNEAIARLKRAGWTFLIGKDASAFMDDLIGMDIGRIMEEPEIRSEVKREIGEIMKTLYSAPVVRETIALHNDAKSRKKSYFSKRT